MGTVSGDGYYQEVDEARWALNAFEEEAEVERFAKERQEMDERYRTNSIAETGATIECAYCGRKVVKKTYQQKFCPPIVQGPSKKKTYRCKDRYNNQVSPRGIYGHLA